MYEEHRRSALKTITWRIIATCTGMFLVYFFTDELELAASFGVADVVLKMSFYFLHERVWNRIEFGRGLIGTVGSAMRSPAIIARNSDTVSSVVQKMITNDIGAIIVTDGNKPYGLITEGDVLERVLKTSKDPTKTSAKDVMSSPLITVEYNRSLTDVLKMMRSKKIRRIAVTQRGKVVGVITERRLLRALI